MKPLIIYICIFASVSCSFAQTEYTEGQLLVIPKSLIYAPQPESEWATYSDGLNDIFETYNVEKYAPAFPYSHHPYLARWYQLTCDCDPIELFDELENVEYNFFDAKTLVPVVVEYYQPNDWVNQTTCGEEEPLWHLEKINAEEAWDITKGDSTGNISIAIVDVGFDTSHVDLSGKVAKAMSMDQPPLDIDFGTSCKHGHGTQVAGTASANTDNDAGIAAIGFKTKLLLYLMADQEVPNTPCPFGYVVGINGAVQSLYDGADVINLSWGYNGSFIETDTNAVYFSDIDSLMGAHIEEIANTSVPVVISAGNDPDENDTIHLFNGLMRDCPYTIAVTGTDSLDLKAFFASYHQGVDLSAPGEAIVTIAVGSSPDSCSVSNGTSFSAPMTSGLIGLMLSLNPCLTRDEILYILQESSVNIDGLNPAFADSIGTGRIDAEAALQMVLDSFQVYQADITDDVTITDEVTWSHDTIVEAQITVEGKLTINNGAVIQFADAQQTGNPCGILVVQGGKLIVDSATLTSVQQCVKHMWDGINVLAEHSKAQPPNPLSENNETHGVVSLTNGATIENARVGIYVGAEPGFPYYLSTDIFNGGIVSAQEAIFRNNRSAVVFRTYNKPNKSSFAHCVFEQTELLNDMERFNNRNIDAFVKLISVKGIKFRACEFRQEMDEWFGYKPSLKGVGIRSFNSSFSINSCCSSTDTTVFENLYTAIEAFGIGAPNRHMFVKYTQFLNNNHGISTSGSVNDEIDNCYFLVPASTVDIGVDTCGGGPGPGGEQFYNVFEKTWGIFSDAALGIRIMNNVFDENYPGDSAFPVPYNPSCSDFFYDNTYGIIARNSYDGTGLILFNEFDSLDIATQTEENNRLLKIKCNEYSSHNRSWLLNPGYLTAQDDTTLDTLMHQGFSCGEDSVAGDLFFDAMGTADITSKIHYRYYSWGFDPVEVPSSTCDACEDTVTICSGAFSNDGACSSENNPGIPSWCQEFGDISSLIDAINNMKREGDKIYGINRALFEMEKDTTSSGGDSLLRKLLINLDHPYANRLHVALALTMGLYKEAQDTLDQLVMSDLNMADYIGLYEMLIDHLSQEDTTLEHLDLEERGFLEDIQEHRTVFSTYAENILTYLNEEPFSRLPQKYEPADTSSPRKPNPEIRQSHWEFKLYPNPTANNVTLKLKNSVSEFYYMEIFNLLGQSIKSSLINAAEISIDLSGFDAGTYFVSIRDLSDELRTQKLIIIK